MKHTSKIVTVSVLLTVLAAGSVFARSNKKGQNQPFMNGPGMQGQNMPCPEMGRDFSFNGFGKKAPAQDEKVVIGKIKSVNQKADSITIVNADGNDILISVTPFARIRCRPLNPPAFNKDNKKDNRKMPPVSLKIEDLKEGEWVKITTYETDTKTPVVKKIVVLRDIAE